MKPFYSFAEQAGQLYTLLQDEKSKKLFWDRLKCDIFPTVDYVADLYADAFDLDERERLAQKELPKIVKKLHDDGKKLLLYGAGGCGNAIAEILSNSGVPFDGFCDKKSEVLKQMKEKPVFSPEFLLSHSEEYYVIIAVEGKFHEILTLLKEHHFPESHILPYFAGGAVAEPYFDFPEFYRPGTAFIDGGCYDTETSFLFSQWCGGQYSNIFAFEPDTQNVKVIQKKMKERPIKNFQLHQAGLSRSNGEANFVSMIGASGYISEEASKGKFTYDHKEIIGNQVSIPLVSLDDVAKDIEVGFIKLDIEGAELDALAGAERILSRDKPLLAISAYHRKGDVLALMDYLHTVVPEYRFWIRHYTALHVDTVLYAAVPQRG